MIIIEVYNPAINYRNYYYLQLIGEFFNEEYNSDSDNENCYILIATIQYNNIRFYIKVIKESEKIPKRSISMTLPSSMNPIPHLPNPWRIGIKFNKMFKIAHM